MKRKGKDHSKWFDSARALKAEIDAVKPADDTAMDWYREHMEHVDRLIQSTANSYPPSGSDAIRPELWKAAHWRWFLKH